MLVSTDDGFCKTEILKSDGGIYAPFYNREYGKNLITEKVDERYARLLRKLNRADVIEFVKEKRNDDGKNDGE